MKKTTNKNNHLEEAVAILIQNQAQFVAQLAETNRELLESKRAVAEQFALVNQRLARIETILVGLPEAVKEKIGFRPPKK
jgi:hypothetical protein